MTDTVVGRNGPKGLAGRDAFSCRGKSLYNPLRPPLWQRDRLVDREVPLLGHAASFPIGVAL